MSCLTSAQSSTAKPLNFPTRDERKRRNYRHDRMSSVLISIGSFLRGLPMFISDGPKTPLRVLCVMAIDTLHMLRNSKPLPAPKVKMLAALLDFGGCANAAFDNKAYCGKEFHTTLQRLDRAGIRSSLVEFLQRLRELERSRPLPGGDYRQFHAVRSYREAVVRLSLGMVATTALGYESLEDGIVATYSDDGLEILLRIVMQCQIIDDVLDYSRDSSAGLPSFLTASQSLPQSFNLTRLAALGYADDRNLTRSGDMFCLRLALIVVSTCTKWVIAVDRWSRRVHPYRGFPSATDNEPVNADDICCHSRPSRLSWLTHHGYGQLKRTLIRSRWSGR